MVLCHVHLEIISCHCQVDLCHGPHLPNTGLLRASAVNAVNRAYWRADVNQEPLQVLLQPQPPCWTPLVYPAPPTSQAGMGTFPLHGDLQELLSYGHMA